MVQSAPVQDSRVFIVPVQGTAKLVFSLLDNCSRGKAFCYYFLLCRIPRFNQLEKTENTTISS